MNLAPVTEAFYQDNQTWLGSAHGTNMGRPITLDVSAFTSGTHYPNGYFPSGLPLAKIAATGLYGPYAASANEAQTATITGAPTGGTFTLTWNGQTTAAIAYNAAASAVQSALEALTNIEPGDVSVSGSAGGPYTVTFKGRFAGEDVAAMTASGASLTGGTSPGVTIATATAGGDSASDGTGVLAGFLLTPVKAPTANTTDVQGVLYEHGRVVTANLPIAVDDAAKADVAGRIIFA